VTQEALHNPARHANANRVEVTLTCSDQDGLELKITDDGQGFNLAQKRGGLGLVSIDERADWWPGMCKYGARTEGEPNCRFTCPCGPREYRSVEEAHESTESVAC
jgi:nitrate/nitrite-specific signal transduction histidine kinase